MASAESESSNPAKWSIKDVAEFIKRQPGLNDLALTFEENDVDGGVLFKLRDGNLKEMGIKSVGKRMKLLEAIKKLKPSSRSARSRRDESTSSILSTTTTTADPRDEFYSSKGTVSTTSTGWRTSKSTSALSSEPSDDIRTDVSSNPDDNTDLFSSVTVPPCMSEERGREDHLFAAGHTELTSSKPVAVTEDSDDPCMSTPITPWTRSRASEIVTPLSEPGVSCVIATPPAMTEVGDIAESSNEAPTRIPDGSYTCSSIPMSDRKVGESSLHSDAATMPTVTGGATDEAVTGTTEEYVKITLKQKLRTYQEELIDKINKARAKSQNVIVCAPTGSGKTLVATRHCADVIMEERSIHLEGDPSACIYFIVPTVHLVDQQAKYMKETLDGVRVGQITGDQKEETTLYEQSQINDIVVMTPAILVNALKEQDPQVKLSNVPLLVLDECHHTEKEHPYMQVMDIYLKQKFEENEVRGSLPYILGMTATLGMGSVSTPRDAKSHVLTLCANLDSPEIVQVSDHCDELFGYVSHPNTELISVNKRAVEDHFHLKFVRIMIDIQRKAGLPEKPHEHGSQEYVTVINQYRDTVAESGNHEALFYVKMLISYNRGLQVYQDMSKEEALDSLHREFSGSTAVAEGNEKLIRMMQNERQSIVDQLQELKAVRSLENPKLEALKRLLLDEFEKSHKAKGIVFMKTREFTHALVKWINADDHLSHTVKPKRLVGGGSETKDRMTKADQLQAIRSFGEGDCNLLVATTIGEEGLDIPECNFVVRYEVVTSEIGEVQARGRARVRVQSSRFVEIVTRGSPIEAHAIANKYRRELMNEASEAVKCLPESELLNEIHKRQMERLKQVSEKARRLRMRRQSSRSADVRLQCQQCGVDVCQASDILHIDSYYVVPGASLDTKLNIVRKSPDPRFGKVGKIYCKKCGADWGVLKQFGNGEEAPALKCSSFLFNISGNLKVIKKWKGVPFEVQEGSEDDLN